MLGGALVDSTRGADEPHAPKPDAREFSDEERAYWSFQPVVDRVPPAVKQAQWVQSPLDAFILAGLERAGLAPAAPAEKRVLLRRATFDLTGLPPTIEEINAFLGDDSPDAFARVIERLLASPQYGERWGRHWLDVARYADSNGMDENLAYGNAYRYRDYVIAAFNRDMPYHAFVREQIAGDLLASRADSQDASTAQVRPESLIATGFLSLGPKMLAEDDPVKMEMDIIDEQLDTIGRTFMGLTLGCARCHDHKFDPIRMDDYYALAGIFKSTRTMDNFKVVARWQERPIGSKDQIEQQAVVEQRISDKKLAIKALREQANESILSDARGHAAEYLRAATALLRQELAHAGLSSLLAGAPAPAPGTLLIEAEKFTSGNVKKDFAGYGEKIGVIYNQGELPNVAEYAIEIAVPAVWQLELRYAAAAARPVRLSINNQLIQSAAAARATGSWFPDTQAWHAEAVVRLPAGTSIIRLERDEPFPHFDKLALVPIAASAGHPPIVVQAAGSIAPDLQLNRAIVDNWVRYLKETRRDPGSALYAWHVVTGLADLPHPGAGEPGMPESSAPAWNAPPPNTAPLFFELRDAAERALVARYRELFQEADQAWRESKSRADGANIKELPNPRQESLRRVLYDSKGPFATPANPESHYAAETRSELDRLTADLAALEKSFTPLPAAMAVSDGQSQDLRVHLRGSHLALGDQTPRRFPRIFHTLTTTDIGDQSSGRDQLADWLTDPAHPLTSRVMVNRIWHWHFGEALVRSTDNFGRLGDRPHSPDLLDWLAARFVESGWSVKAMHRLIMNSATYQMSTAFDPRAAEIDPDNRLHWRMNRRRLEAEAIRDALLAAAGQLNLAMGGSLLDSANRAYVKGYPNSVYDNYDFNRRSVYLPVLRSMLYDVFQAFDFADPSAPNGERASTTVAPQALFMMNSKLVAAQSRHLAMQLLASHPSDAALRVTAAYERALGRPATAIETSRALDFVRRYRESVEGEEAERELLAWQALCRTVLASNEFIFLE